MKKAISLFSSVILLALGGYAIPPFCPAYDLFTESYLIQPEDPCWMQLLWQTDTNLQGGWVRWGYSPDKLDHMERANLEHQNIKNEGLPLQPAQDFIRWDVWVGGANSSAAPGMHIYYKVFVSKHMDFKDNNAEYSFKGNFILPLVSSARHLTFYGYGDTRECGTAFHRVSQAINDDMVDDAINHKTFLLHAGDVVYNGGRTFMEYKDNRWMEYFSNYDPSKYILHSMPIVLAMGNHDFNWQDYGNWPKYYFTDFPYPQYDKSIGSIPHLDDHGKLVGSINDAYYSYDYGPVHVAVLDAYTNGELGHQGGCHIGSNLETGKKQYKWLENDLAATDKPWKVILMHVSPLSCDCSINDDVRHDLEDLAKAQGVDLLISAHDHYYHRALYDGLTHLVLGGGGATLDCGNSCKEAGCFYHYARFHVVNDGRLDVKVFKVDKDTGDVSEKDSFFISQTEPQTTIACFEVSSYSHDYRLPTRFTCTSPGLHTKHNWDLGDGTHSTDENPYHSYPKPTNASATDTYTVALTVSDDTGTWHVQTEKEVTVYISGKLQIIVETEVIYPAEYAVFLRPRGVPLNEVRDFLGFHAEAPILEVKPGDWTLTVRPLGYKDWEGNVTIKGDVWTVKYAYPEKESHPDATIAIGSVPTGADVTAVAKTGWGSQTVSGTTPFLVNVCCPGTEPDQEYECSLDYNVQTGGVTVKGVSDICTKYGESSCGVCLDGVKYIYLDLRPAGAAEEDRRPVIMRQPSDQEVVENGRAYLRISARSRDTLIYRWYEGISGDTSNPIYGGTGPIYITPELTEAKDYWVRVHDGYRESYVDSRTATVTVVNPEQGPELTGALPPYAIPTSQVTLHGLRFDPGEYGENRVFFDEYEASVEWTTETECVVTAPYELETGESADVQIMVSGVWSNTIQMEVRDDLPILASGDYDGDGKSEIALFRPDTGLWAVRGLGRIYFGRDGDIPVSGDYNGDGYTDVSIFRPSTGLWAVKEVTRAYFGGSDDIPVPGDYDGDGSCDLAVLGRTSARWAVRGITRIYFGTSDNYPAPGDYDGDGSLDIAAFRPSSGLWAIRDISRCYFGTMSDVPVPGVYRWYGSSRAGGPFRSQIAVFRPSSGLWAIRQVSRFYFGTFGDKPLRGDFTGSSLDAIGIFRGSSGLWSIRGVTRVYYGTSGDTPVAR